MLHGFPRTRTGETVDCKVLSHFGLTQGDLYADCFFVGRAMNDNAEVVALVYAEVIRQPKASLMNAV